MIKASDCKCIECGEQAVDFWPVIDPDIPSHPYCRKCLDKAKQQLFIKLTEIDKKNNKAMTDEQLKAMSKADANKLLSRSDMHRWVQLHNATANLYFIKNGQIEDVEPSGWWY